MSSEHSAACQNISFLRLLGSSNRKRKKELIQLASKKEILAICECIDNLLKGKIPLSKKKKNYFKRFKKHLRYLVKYTNPSEEKRAILCQHGGFLTFLLPLALSALMNVYKFHN